MTHRNSARLQNRIASRALGGAVARVNGLLVLVLVLLITSGGAG